MKHTTYPTPIDFDENLILSWLRLRNVFDANISLAVEASGLHYVLQFEIDTVHFDSFS